MTILSSALEAIGHTPLVALDRLHPGPGRILVKLEFLNPGGSIKDRAARAIIRRARELGDLRPGQPVVEMTSGNMGSGLALVCGLLGHPFTAVMPAGNSPERARMMRGLGATVVLVPQVDGQPGQVTGGDVAAASAHAEALAREQGAYYVDQFNNPGSILGHYESTGPEIWEQTGGKLDALVATVGSGGSFTGTAKYLRERRPGLPCYAVEPASAAVLAGRAITQARHVIQGVGYGLVPPHFQRDLCTGCLGVSDEEVLRTRELLGTREGLFVGFSAGANVAAARNLLLDGSLGPQATVVTLLCDHGLKY